MLDIDSEKEENNEDRISVNSEVLTDSPESIVGQIAKDINPTPLSNSSLESLGFEFSSEGSDSLNTEQEIPQPPDPICKKMGENKNSLIVLYTNSDVYLNKKEELVLQIDQYRPDIVAMVEVLPQKICHQYKPVNLRLKGIFAT